MYMCIYDMYITYYIYYNNIYIYIHLFNIDLYYVTYINIIIYIYMYGGGVDLTYWGFPCLPRKGFPVTVSGNAFDTGLVMLWLGDDMTSSQDWLGI